MKGLTLNKGAVNRWLLSDHKRAAIAKECDNMAGKRETEKGSKELNKIEFKRMEVSLEILS